MTAQRIQRKRTKGWRLPPNTVCVSRPSKWGNPFRASVLGRKTAVRRYAVWLLWSDDPRAAKLREEARTELRGKDLACWCPITDAEGNPVPCHAEILLNLSNAPEEKS